MLLALALSLFASADSTWQKPPKEILEVLHAPALPNAFLDPTRTTMLLGTPVEYPPLADLSQPWLKLAGTRVVTRNRSHYDPSYWSAFDLVSVADGSVRHIALPAGMKAQAPDWSADGTRFAFSVIAADAVELWTGDVATAKVRRVEGLRLNPFFGSPSLWMPDQKALLVQSIPMGQGKPPAPPAVPPGPNVKETTGGSASSTYELRDVLTSDHDEALFEYYGAAQMALVDVASSKVTPVGKPGLYIGVSVSPDGQLLMETITRPFSRLTTYGRFPREVDVWDRSGKLVKHIASLPLHENVPIWGEPEGPREFQWRTTAPSTLFWAEALADGNWVVDQEGDTVWLRGQGASTEGDRPFLDRFDVKTLTAERLFRCEKTAYQSFAAWTDRAKGEFLVRHETPTAPPNYFVRTVGEKIANAPEGEPQRASANGRQVTKVYVKVSPYFHADKLKLPVLLIHGEADVNPGTVPLQSQILYEAIRGHGGVARLVTLPYESHGYSAIESNEQVLYEQMAWFDKYVKNAGPKPKKTGDISR
jgi:dipeptidyl aminopeptidase/acylaminoacyl peptidase